jgi:hypothetical protein
MISKDDRQVGKENSGVTHVNVTPELIGAVEEGGGLVLKLSHETYDEVGHIIAGFNPSTLTPPQLFCRLFQTLLKRPVCLVVEARNKSYCSP